MLFADDIVLMYESREDVNAKVKKQRETVECKCVKISCTKAVYMDCNFNRHLQKTETTERIEAQ